MRGPTVEVHGYLKRETERAVLFSPSDDPTTEVWLPRSQIRVTPSDDGDGVDVVMQERLFIEKGLG